MSFELAVVLLIIINLIGFYPYRRRVRVINIMIISLIIFFLSTVRDTPDINNYMLRFSSNFFSVKDVGFNLLTRFFYTLEWDYFEYQTFIYVCCISLICQGLIRAVEERTLVYILYCFYPLLLNAIQIRNMIATSLFILAVCICSMEKNEYKRKIKWCILIAVSTSIHMIMIVFIPFIFIYKRNEIMQIAVNICLVASALMYIIPDVIVGVIARGISFVDKSSRGTGFLMISTRFGGVVMIVEAFVLYYYAKMACICGKRSAYYIADEKSEYSDFMARLMHYSLLFTPLYVMNGNFMRLAQNESILLYALFSVSYSMGNCPKRFWGNIKGRKDMFLPFVLIFLVFIRNVISLWISSYDNIVRPLFSNI